MLHLPPRRPERASRKRVLAAALLSCLVVAATAQNTGGGDSHRVMAVRFWSLADVTRIAIETDGDFQVRSDRLTNPDRIFFDLEGTRPALGSKSMTVIPVADHLLEKIRVAAPQPNTTRVVLDLSATVEATTERLENPNRLIIELRSVGGQPAKPSEPSLPAPSVQRPPIERAQLRPFQPPPTPSAAAPKMKHVAVALLDPPSVATSMPRPSASLTAAMNPTLPASALAKPAPAVSATPVAVSSPEPVVASLPPTPQPHTESSAPAKRNTTGERSMIRALGLKVERIVLDPGHGGHDTGTVGPNGLREKDLVLDVAQRLGALIHERMGSEVIYTRTDDSFIPLERRTEIANEAKADLFLSIHANSSPLASAAGVETYYLNFTTSRTALDVAARENAGSEKTVFELQELLQKIALKDKVEESREFASRIENSLYALSVRSNARAKDRGVKKAPFVVLIGANMPSVLTEIGFISNLHDENTMKRPDHRERIAEALFKGLAGYANSLSHFQVAQRQ